jgi:hypothetical protein
MYPIGKKINVAPEKTKVRKWCREIKKTRQEEENKTTNE